MESRLVTALSRLSPEEPDNPDIAPALVAFTRLDPESQAATRTALGQLGWALDSATVAVRAGDPERVVLGRREVRVTIEQMGYREVGSGPTFAFEDTREHFDPRIELADWFDDAR